MEEKRVYDYSNLINKMKESGKKQVDIARILGKNVATVSQKLNSHTAFTQTEKEKVCDYLAIEPIKISEYFFTH